MGVSCEISLKTPVGGVFLAGSFVTGEIKYAVKEDTVFKRITMSLKGIGTISIKKKSSRRQTTTYNKERYVNINEIILDKSNQNRTTLDSGSYIAPFKFKLPERVPPSVNIIKRQIYYDLKYKVTYFVSMKFERTGFLAFPKRFRKEIQVVSDVTPTLSRDPLTYGEQNKLFHPFSSTDSIISIKSTILDSVVRAGDNLHFEYEVANNSHVAIKAVETKIREIIKPKKRRKHVNFKQDLPGTDSKTRSIEVGATQQLFVDIKIPEDSLTIDSCELATRNYTLNIVVELPMPYINFQLSIPIQVSLKRDEVATQVVEDAPPSYWDVMCENEKKLEDF